MKLKLQHFTVVTVLFLSISWHASAQTDNSGDGSNSGLPLASGKTIIPRKQTIPTVAPNPSGPIRPSEGSGTLGPESAANRPVMWVHGHGGNGGSWDRAASATQEVQIPNVANYPPRKVTTRRLDYSSSSNTISAAATLLKSTMESYNFSPQEKEDAIVIAHSMGGLVSSYIDYLYDSGEPSQNRTFHGLVTVGTPHLGALLAKNSYPYPGSKANEFANKACNALVTGPVLEKIETSFWLKLLLNSSQVTKLTDQFCNFVSNDLATVVLQNFNAPIANDLKPNNELLNTLQGFTPQETHRIAFYATLPNDDLLWRTYHYMKNGPNADGYFEADKAQESVNLMHSNRNKYKAKWSEWNAKAQEWQDKINSNCPWAGFYCTNIWPNKRDEAQKVADAYYNGMSWWTEANEEFRLMIGDLAMAPNPQQQCQCTTYAPDPNTGQMVTTGPTIVTQPNNTCVSSYNNPVYQFCNWVHPDILQDFDSDGIVTSASAMAFPGASNFILMQGDSHFQMVNSPRIKTALNGLWNTGHGDSFFITPPK